VVVKTTGAYIDRLAALSLPTIFFRVTADLPSDAIVIVCRPLTCLEPARSWEMLLKQLRFS
jgi:hypothetical protein